MKIISILGTGTDVGKTIVSAALFAFLKEQGADVKVQKWVSSGDKGPYSGDLFFALQFPFLRLSDNPFSKLPVKKIRAAFQKDLPFMNLYSFHYPASPHLVSKKEAKPVRRSSILKSIAYFKKQNPDYLIIEGVGGIMTPLSSKLLYADLLEELRLPSIITVNNILGAINASLLTVNELKRRHVPVLGFVFNNFFKNTELIRKDNRQIIQKMSGIKRSVAFGSLQMKRQFIQLGQKIMTEIADKSFL